MNREIKFRGKCKEGGFWVYGNIIQESYAGGCVWILAPQNAVPFDDDLGYHFVEVFRETIGQFTGLTDKDGRDIYEGDVVKWEYAKRAINDEGFYVKTGEVEGVFFEEVKYEAGYYHLGGYDPLNREEIEEFGYVVCGNIHDNPELINEGGEK